MNYFPNEPTEPGPVVAAISMEMPPQNIADRRLGDNNNSNKHWNYDESL